MVNANKPPTTSIIINISFTYTNKMKKREKLPVRSFCIKIYLFAFNLIQPDWKVL